MNLKKLKKNKFIKKYGNYIFVVGLILFVFIFSFLSYKIASAIINSGKNSSYLVNKKLVNKSFKIEDDLSEMFNNNGDYFIYLTYKGSKEINNFEKSIKPIIKDNKLKDKLYYIDISTLQSSNNISESINDFLKIDRNMVTKVPTIIYVNKNNKIEKQNIITRLDDNLIEKGDFQQLLDIIK